MRRILIILCVIALLVLAGCVQKRGIKIIPEEVPAKTGDSDIDADFSELNDDSLEEELNIEDTEIEELENIDF